MSIFFSLYIYIRVIDASSGPKSPSDYESPSDDEEGGEHIGEGPIDGSDDDDFEEEELRPRGIGAAKGRPLPERPVTERDMKRRALAEDKRTKAADADAAAAARALSGIQIKSIK